MRAPPASALLLLAAGFGIWATAFVVLYAALSVGCAFGWDGREAALGLSLQRAMLLGLLLAFLALHAALLVHLRARPPSETDATAVFVHRAALIAGTAAMGASVFTYAAVAILSTCTP